MQADIVLWLLADGWGKGRRSLTMLGEIFKSTVLFTCSGFSRYEAFDKQEIETLHSSLMYEMIGGG